MENEIWKDVVGYEGIYEVSDFGRVRRKKTLHILRGSIRNNYLCVDLCNRSNDKTRPSHQLVVETFIDKDYKQKGLVVDHKDMNKLNNSKNNLRVVTQRVNTLTGRAKSGLTGAYKVGNMFNSKIKYNGISVNLGCFKTKEEANDAHRLATLEIELGIFSFETTNNRLKEKQKYKGISFRKDINKWVAGVKINYKAHYVGAFLDREDAYKALCEYKKIQGIEF